AMEELYSLVTVAGLKGLGTKKHTQYLKTLENSRPLPDFEEYAIDIKRIWRIDQYAVSKNGYGVSMDMVYPTLDMAYPGQLKKILEYFIRGAYAKQTRYAVLSNVFGEPPYPFDYPMRRLTMEEMLAKFIDEGRREHEEMEILIKEFRTTNELLLKTRSNLLSELKIEVNELSKVMSNVLIPKNEVKGVTTRGGKMTSEATHSKKINETGINKNEPPRFEQDVQEKPHDDCVENKSSSIRERTTQPLVKPQQSSIPFPNRVRKEKEEALQRNFLENLKQLDINIPFIEALVQIPKYAKYLKSLLTNKSRLEEACTETMNERCSTVLLNELPSKEKDPRSFTTPCQVLEKHKEAEDLAADHLSRFENPHMEVLTEREIADKFSDEHLMVLKSKFNNDEPWYADFVNYIVGKCMTRSSTNELLSPFENSEHKFCSKRRLFDTPSLIESNSPEFDYIFDIKEQSKEGERETMTETMEQGKFLKELHDNTFSGSEHEDINEHIKKVLEIIDLFHIPKVTQDQITLRAFPVSLTGAASRWLRNQPSGSITIWEVLKTKFLNKYCPPVRTAKKMEEINNFQQELDESLFRAWERFKELLMKCPQHYLTDMQEGDIPSKTAADAKIAIQEMAEYSQKWHNGTSSRTRNMAPLPATDQRHPWLRYQIEEYTEEIRHRSGSEVEDGIFWRGTTSICESCLEAVVWDPRVFSSRVYSRVPEYDPSFNDAAIRNQGASIKTLEIKIGQMSKVLQERGFGSLPGSTKTNPRDQVKSISTAKANFSKIRRIGHEPYAVSALVDLGASVSVMPFSTYTNLGLGILSHTRLTIELADQTIKQPRGIAVNVLDEGKSHAGTLIDIPVFVGSFSIISSFTIIDDDVMTKDVVLGMKFCKKYASCQRIMKRFALGNNCERIMED
ncbi:reverse transcriptase domain-containing protein, partial [Tanacetum coccineum]